MEINNKILGVFKEFGIVQDDGICYLIALFHNYRPSYIPDKLRQQVNATGIVEVRDKLIYWNIPLYTNQVTGFDWVKTEYVPMFKKANPEKGGYVREAIKRIKQLLADNPDIRKDDIINATKLYLSNTDYRYIRNPHYFITKGVGVNKTHDILTWIDKLKESESQIRTSITRKLQ